MMRGWITVLVLGALTFATKAAGPVLLGSRTVSQRLLRVLALMAPALFAALVALQVFASGDTLTLDPRVGGLAVAALGAWRKAPMLAVIAGAVATTALLRLLMA